MASSIRLVVDPFCHRQFSPTCTQTRVPAPYDSPELFLDALNRLLQESPEIPLVDGYAPFCKHIFVPNFAGCACGYASLSVPAVAAVVESDYEARRSNEVPVLVRYVRASRLPGGKAPIGKFLDIILYSREQIILENKAMGGGGVPADEDAVVPEYDYGIISVKCIDQDAEVPMTPITIFRNALGKEEGGSGVPLVKEVYMASVAFWKDHVSVIAQ